jgi:aldose 1-epimerase
MTSAVFSHAVEVDPETNWSIAILRYQDRLDPRRNLEARIAPEAGSNLYSLKLGGLELLVNPERLSDLPGYRFGFPVLYPTPNRVRDSRFTFDGMTLRFTANDETHFLHGLVHSLKWQSGVPSSDGEGAHFATWLDWDSKQDDFTSFPFMHRISLTFTLTARSLRIAFAVENQGDHRLPFGFALHPWFRILGSRSETYLQVPAEKHMEAVGLIPTGRLAELEGSSPDLRTPVSLGPLDLDDVYWGMRPDRPAGYEARDKKVKVTLAASSEFTHMVIYTPKGELFFCMENQTCSTDAHNLFVRGFTQESHLLIAERGKPVVGWVDVRPKYTD